MDIARGIAGAAAGVSDALGGIITNEMRRSLETDLARKREEIEMRREERLHARATTAADVAHGRAVELADAAHARQLGRDATAFDQARTLASDADTRARELAQFKRSLSAEDGAAIAAAGRTPVIDPKTGRERPPTQIESLRQQADAAIARGALGFAQAANSEISHIMRTEAAAARAGAGGGARDDINAFNLSQARGEADLRSRIDAADRAGQAEVAASLRRELATRFGRAGQQAAPNPMLQVEMKQLEILLTEEARSTATGGRVNPQLLDRIAESRKRIAGMLAQTGDAAPPGPPIVDPAGARPQQPAAAQPGSAPRAAPSRPPGQTPRGVLTPPGRDAVTATMVERGPAPTPEDIEQLRGLLGIAQ